MKFSSVFFLLLIATVSMAQLPKHKAPYKLFNKKGKKVSYRKMIKKLAKSDVILFGELHNNPIAHWMEVSLAHDLSNEREIIIGTEMLERDGQMAINDYLAGKIDAKELVDTLNEPTNFKTDYKPILDFAKAKKIKFIGSNIPRRFASIVYHQGFEGLDSLTLLEKSWIAPLPIVYDPEMPSYQAMLAMMGGHGGANLPKAQAIKDATMSHFILKNMEKGKLFFHFNGSYHSNDYEGIYWYLKKALPALDCATISVVSQENLKKLDKESIGIADFIIVVDEKMTTSY